MDIIVKLKEELKVEKWQVEAAVKLIDEGNTIPFISCYRKEATGSLNDEVLRNLYERLTYLRNLEEKKEQVIGSIEEQGKLTDELKEKILAAETMVAVEDLYRPYRPKRRTRATVAKEKGLEFRLKVDASIPSMLCGDEVRIKQILINLLNNAVKYTNEGQIQLKITWERRQKIALLHIAISDTGIGITEENKKKLFQSFQRVDT